jgi:sugar-specific transcriptional regulator TrmB
MNNLNIEKLVKLGLQINEAKTYLALLEIGKGTITQISNLSKLNRTTGYDILERLGQYGLITRSKIGNKQIYVSEPPSRLKQFLENKKASAERRLESVGGLISELESLHKKESKPVIKFFEGREGIQNIYLHTLESQSTIYSILDLDQYLPEFQNFGDQYVKERTKKGIKEKVLVQKNEKGLEFYNKIYSKSKHRREFTEYRWLDPKKNFSPATEVNIYDDKVIGVLVKPGENVAFEIQSKSFANSFRLLFELAWEQAEKLK